MRLTRRDAMKLTCATAFFPEPGRAATVLRIGYQRYSTLIITKHLGLMEKALAPHGITVSWAEFVAGPQLLQALAAGAIDLGQTGDAPPVFAEAAQPGGLVYLGYEPPAPEAEAILVRKDSAIRQMADLRGMRIALNRGSNVHWFLLEALRHAGLGFHDVHVSYLTPPAARAAFENGHIDAWAIWDPYFSSALNDQTRILTTAEGIVENREFFLISKALAQQPHDIVAVVSRAIAQTDAWAMENKVQVAALFSKETGLALDAISHALSTRSFGFHSMDQAMIDDQTNVAKGLKDSGLIPYLPAITPYR
ncbi:aliphatic sulfonate ABC transporter substrate-binding protein [Asaia krungthepensis]|uniref:Aliphatic sulphonate ABC transporter periplasmic protein n=1 Tax=Asaia krungthepensis NRIC 0535 TaxID=1307925 RepID=A0ABQ0PWW9_9PROT|nr:aliphatic sulfonate ABC transporter substrate-binding protein [Asaia krungthepensis]GBQ83654.1 aliphatic sulphonate ABC transporter periplasmic protein [Asaia krungthepensis NRIC 0535]